MNRLTRSACIGVLCSCWLSAGQKEEPGRILAAGPAWAVDVAHLSGPIQNGLGSMQAQPEATYVPANAHWVTYVIRSGETTYITREKTKSPDDVEAASGNAILFKVAGSHLVWRTASGRKHSTHLVIR